jgi:hypothetical protein
MLQPPNAVDALTYVPPLDPLAPLRAALRGHYEIEREIGQGAFATVYLARDLKHERKVALKVLNADPTSETGELRFIREIRVLARLQHPNILPLHDSGHVDALLYYVMPYVTGETLRGRIDREKQLPVEAACTIAREVAEALGYAHAQGIIHRDIKPENILLSAGHPVLADFGIARVIDVAGVVQLTKTGMGSPGTPAYMSPEQLMGDQVLDGRSDTYSLGCVLFEMLTGKPPFPGKDGFVKRFTEPPPSARAIRRELAAGIDEILARALARNPGERYSTAQELVAALCDIPVGDAVSRKVSHAELPAELETPETHAATPGATSAVPIPTANVRSVPANIGPALWTGSGNVRKLAFGIVGAVVLVAVILFRNNWPDFRRSATVVNPSRVALFPFRGDRHGTALVSSGVREALNNWRGLDAVSDLEIADASPTGAKNPLSLSQVRDLSRRLGAGKFIWGEVTGAGDSAQARIELYDASGNQPPRPAASVVEGVVADRATYAKAVMLLLKDPARPAAADGGDGGTRSFAAWNDYGAAHIALARWDLPLAEVKMRQAISDDATFAAAAAWLAQIIAWNSPDRKSDWQDLARRAIADSSRLAERDRVVASALVAMAERRYPDACRSYAGLASTSPLDFLGQFGLGECQSLDSAVLRDPRAASGWRFRGSKHSAVSAYLKAFNLDPGAHALFTGPKLDKLLPIGPTVARVGISLTDTTQFFAAFPTLEGDTVAYVPYPFAAFGKLSHNPKTDAALRANIQTRVTFASGWARRFPTSANAQEAFADALEARGDLADDQTHSDGVVRAIDAALRFSTEPEQKLRLNSARVRARLKRGEINASERLADSLLRATPLDSVSAIELQWVAALTGRAQLAAAILRAESNYRSQSGIPIPPAVSTASSKFFAYSALGVCGADLNGSERALATSLENEVAVDVRSKLKTELMTRSLSLASPCTRGASALQIDQPMDDLQFAQRAFAQGDLQTARRLLALSSLRRRHSRPSDISLDYIYQEAWLLAQVGDTAGAISSLDAGLGALPLISTAAFKELAGAASIGRAMNLRAELAAKTGDRASAKKWGAAVDTLWRGADPQLRTR